MFKFANVHMKIVKVPKLIKQFESDFKKLDFKLLRTNMVKLYSMQVAMMHSTCIDSKGLSAEPLMIMHKHIITTIGKDQYLKILEANTENYSIFRSTTSIVSTYCFISLAHIAIQDIKGLELIFSSYGMYAYSLMFNKRINYCKPDVFEAALNRAHGLNEFSKLYKKGGHVEVVTYFVEAELSKLINFINHDEYTVVRFSRAFSYIKHRFNQTIGSFSKVYHQIINETAHDEPGDSGVTSSELGMMVKQVMNAHQMISNLPPQVITALNRNTNLDNKLAEAFVKSEIHLSISDSHFRSMLEVFYDSLFRLNVSNIKKICDSEFLTLIIKIVTAKNASATVIDLKTKIDDLIKYIVSKSKEDISQLSKVITIRQTRVLLARLLYFIYIKNSLCKD